MSEGERVWSIEFARMGVELPLRSRLIRGIQFDVRLSPFFVPININVQFNRPGRRLAIGFEYPTGEREQSVCDREDTHVVIYVGKQSQRVQRIEVTVDDVDGRSILDAVRLNLRLAADQVRKESAQAPEGVRDNYQVVAESLGSTELNNAISASA